MARQSFLAPLSIADQTKYAVLLLNFFSPIKTYEMRTAMGLSTDNGIFPLSFGNFLAFTQQSEPDIYKKRQRLSEIARKLVAHGMLSSCGGADLKETFYSLVEITSMQRKGYLFLGPVLGPRFLADIISNDLVYITGKDESGAESAGTGIQISPTHVVTCGHVISDMSLDEYVTIRDEHVPIESATAHPTIDIGLIKLKKSTPRILNDLAFHQSELLEPILIAGFPPVPLSPKPVLTYQTGEICAQNLRTYFGAELDLFTAIARPGNSGGPVISLNGRIIGIVSQSLEFDGDAQRRASHPFFAAVPATVVREAVSELDPTIVLPWEDYS